MNEKQKPERDVTCGLCGPECARFSDSRAGYPLAICLSARPLLSPYATRRYRDAWLCIAANAALAPLSLLWALPTSACSRIHGEIPLGLNVRLFLQSSYSVPGMHIFMLCELLLILVL